MSVFLFFFYLERDVVYGVVMEILTPAITDVIFFFFAIPQCDVIQLSRLTKCIIP